MNRQRKDSDAELPHPGSGGGGSDGTGSDGATNGGEGQPSDKQSGRYHHGALREALLKAGEEELRERGVEAFSLRSVAKRAGVSHAAPAHHFKDAKALLTELAAIGFRRFVDYQSQYRRNAPRDRRSQLAAGGQAYVAFAEEHTALFRLMFTSDRPDLANLTLNIAATAAFADLRGLVEETIENDESDADGHNNSQVDILTVWGLSHGLATLITSGQMATLRAMPKEDRERLIAKIFARIIRL